MATASNLVAGTEEVDLNKYSSPETIGLLILKELQMMRQDIIASMLRMEEQINVLSGKKSEKPNLQNIDGQTKFNNCKLSTVAAVCENLFGDEVSNDCNYAADMKCKQEVLSEVEKSFPSSYQTDAPFPSITGTSSVNSIEDEVQCSFGNQNYDYVTENENTMKHQFNENFKNIPESHKSCKEIDVQTVSAKPENTASSVNVHPFLNAKSVLKFKERVMGKTFAGTNSSVNRHIPSRLAAKRFVCQVCCQTFFNKNILTRHMHVHSRPSAKKLIQVSNKSSDPSFSKDRDKSLFGNKTCPQCFKTFSTIYTCKRHIQSHTKGKKYHCKVCFKPFHRKDSIPRHMKKHLEFSKINTSVE